jgi:hypothetical protein
MIPSEKDIIWIKKYLETLDEKLDNLHTLAIQDRNDRERLEEKLHKLVDR